MKHFHDAKVKSKTENNVYSKKSSFHSFPLQSVFPSPNHRKFFVFDLVFNFKKYSQCLLFVVLVFYKVLQTPNKWIIQLLFVKYRVNFLWASNHNIFVNQSVLMLPCFMCFCLTVSYLIHIGSTALNSQQTALYSS